jgi:hypothetical protein
MKTIRYEATVMATALVPDDLPEDELAKVALALERTINANFARPVIQGHPAYIRCHIRGLSGTDGRLSQ